jgi:4-amino-4-deoxy-L-arabinose transferase-like glycosyltransferase
MTEPSASVPSSRMRVVWIILAIAFALSLTMHAIDIARAREAHWTSVLNMGGLLVLALSNLVDRRRVRTRRALVAAAVALVCTALALLVYEHTR